MHVGRAFSVYVDVVASSIVFERNMERLMNIAYPMAQKFQRHQLVEQACAENIQWYLGKDADVPRAERRGRAGSVPQQRFTGGGRGARYLSTNVFAFAVERDPPASLLCSAVE